MKRKAENRTRVLPLRAWWILAAIIVGLVIAIRIRLLGIPLERDEGEYAYAGQLMLQGIPPYKLAYNMKFPGTYAAYALLMSIFGQTIVGIHLGLLLVNVAAIALIFFLGRRLVSSIAGITAAASYAVLSANPGVFGLAAHATHFVILPVLGGLLLLSVNQIDSSRAARDKPKQRSLPAVFASGLLFGIGVLMKQPAVFLVLFGAAYLTFNDFRTRIAPKRILFRNLIFGAGALLPFAITCLLLSCAGVFDRFWFWTIDYARQYGSLVSLRDAPHLFAESFTNVIGTSWALWLLAGLGLAIGLWHKQARGPTGFLLVLLGFSLLAVSAGFLFREHYFILILPVLSLFAGLGINKLAELTSNRRDGLRFTAVFLFGLAVSLPIYLGRNLFFEASPAEASRTMYGSNPFPESIKIAEYIRERTTPEDTITVLGSEPQIYFYSRRHSATGYIYTYSLMEAQRYAHQMQEEMIHEVERNHPKYLISVQIITSWMGTRESDQHIVRWAADYIKNQYRAVGLVNILTDRTDFYLETLPKQLPELGNYLLIYERKS